jgi:hypothetical protein
MKQLVLLTFLLLTGTVFTQTRSGNYGHPVYWFNRYKHEIPVVNQIPAMPAITIGSIIDVITEPKDDFYREPSVEEIYREYLTLDSVKQDSIRQVLHPTWTQEMFNRSQSAVYATYKYKPE